VNNCMKYLEKAESILTRVLEGIASLCLLAILVLIVILVTLRYVFNEGIVGANEFATILFVYTTAIGSAVAMGRREHISVDYLVGKLGPGLRRWADAGALVLVAAINGVLLWQSFQWIAVTGSYIMAATLLPRVVVQVSVPIGCSLAIFYCFVRLVTTLRGESGPGAD